MRAACAVVAVAALGAAACGSSGEHVGLGCGESPLAPAPATSGAPAATGLLQDSLVKGLARGSVHVRLALDLRASLPRGRERVLGDSEIDARQIRALADNPFCLGLEGDAGGGEWNLEGTLAAGGETHQVGVRGVHGHLYVRAGGAWYDVGSFLDTELAGGLVPGVACVRGQSEGCTRVDFRPAIRSGLVARLVRGTVGRGPHGTWAVTGRPDPDALDRLTGTGSPESYDPFERRGRILASVDRDDGLLRAFEIRYRLNADDLAAHLRSASSPVTARRARLVVELSDWGKKVSVEEPDARPLDDQEAGRLVAGFLAALSLYY